MLHKPSPHPNLAQLTLAELFERYPHTIAVFNRRGMACVGCEIVAFETVAQAVSIYRLDLATILQEIEGEASLREEL